MRALVGLGALLFSVSLVGDARADDDPCRDSRPCRVAGRCSTIDGKCLADSEADCLSSERCQSKGTCSLDRTQHVCVDEKEARKREAEAQHLASTRRNDPDMFVGGLVVVGIGGAGVVAGALTAFFGGFLGGLSCIGGSGGACANSEEVAIAGGITAAAGAGVALIVGLPLTLVGARRVPVDAKTARAADVRFEVRGTAASFAVDF